jgi:hypothetical protein
VASGRRAVRDREDGLAEVEEEDRVVVDLGRDPRIEELPFPDADPRQGDDCLRGSQHARQLMQGVDGHVVHRPTARAAEVPRRVDRRSSGFVTSLGLVLVVFAESAAAERPGELPDRAALDQLARASQLRPEHLAGRGDEAEVALLRESDQLVGLSNRRRHRLVDVDVLAGLQRRAAVLVVETDGRGHRDGVDIRLGEHLVDAREHAWDAVARGGHFGAVEDRVAQRLDPDAIPDIVLGEVRQDAAERQRAYADHPQSQRTLH